MTARPNKALFVAAILTGSFLLFLIQPMVARMALPRLGGAPMVWNSAMLVYQALLLGGYAYAHRLARYPLRQQTRLHPALLAIAALTLPVGLVSLPAPPPGGELWWVPLLMVLSIGPVFFLVSAQAPLVQRWYAAHPEAGEPWALYAASNLGSFAGLLSYPLVAEPLLTLRQQSWLWSAGYAVLLGLVWLSARARRGIETEAEAAVSLGAVPGQRIALWLVLAMVPSGLMLSTTSHLTTDFVAMPLLWVIPLGLYLLSFSVAFATRRAWARTLTLGTPAVVLLAGSQAMASHGTSALGELAAGLVLLFLVCVSLHARLYESRPDPGQLTLFYLVMAAGGALGGVLAALVAPLLFDWVWEHPLLVVAAALLLPRLPVLDWRRMPGLDPAAIRLGLVVLLVAALFFAWQLFALVENEQDPLLRAFLLAALAATGLALWPWRGAFLAALMVLMLVEGGIDTLHTSWKGHRARSYFGIYTVYDYKALHLRTLAHGTTLHGEQSLDPRLRDVPLSYYGPGSGAGLVFDAARALFGPAARIGVVGLGAGSLACFHQRGQNWTIFEIDPLVLKFSRDGTFTFLKDCAPDARVVIGDARLSLDRQPDASLDLLAIDAFSSDSVPMHLLTDQAFTTYFRVLNSQGLLLVHISNRYIDLEPVLAAEAKQRGLAIAVRDDEPGEGLYSPSIWVLVARDPARLDEVRQLSSPLEWTAPELPAPRAWTDDHASVLPYIRWHSLLDPLR